MRHCSIESRESYVDKFDARKPLDFDLSRISPEYLIDQNFTNPFINCLTIFHNNVFNRSKARTQNNGQLSTVHEPELAINVTYKVYEV